MTNLFRLIIVFLLLFGFVISVSAQKKFLQFDPVYTENKISNNTVYQITQDKQGYLWFATRYGLNRYDGYTFYTLTNKPTNSNSISNNYITCVVADKDGNIWIGTNGGGVNKYSTKDETITILGKDFSKNQQINSNYISTIYADQKDRIWIGTPNEGLICLDQKTDTLSNFSNDPNNLLSISSNFITAIFSDSKARLWVSTTDGLSLFDEKNKTFKRFFPSNKTPNDLSKIVNTVEDLNGNIWVATSDKLCRYDEKANNIYNCFSLPIGNSLFQPVINSISCDHLGILWITMIDKILSFDPNTEKFTEYELSSNLKNTVINQVFFDSANEMWLAASDTGLIKLNSLSNRFSPIRPQFNLDSLSPTKSSVTGFCEDSKSYIWVGTLNGLYRYSSDNKLINKFQSNPKDPNALSSDLILAMAKDSSGLIWIATNKGLKVYSVELEQFITDKLDLPDSLKQIYSNVILEDKKKNLWFGTNSKGIYKFDLNTKTLDIYSRDVSPNKLSTNRVRQIYEDDLENIWVSTGNGLFLYNKEKDSFIAYTHDPQNNKTINTNAITCAYKTKSGIVFVATENGLNKMDSTSGEFSTIPDIALLNDFIYGILEDEKGFLWMSSNKGLIKYDPKTNDIWHYTDTDGLQNNEFNFGSYYKSSKGELFFGGVNGFNRFYPSTIKNNERAPNIVITSFKVYDGSTTYDNYQHFLSANAELNFPYNKNFVEIEFSALNFIRPEKNKYRVKMEGTDKAWIDTDSTKRFARYSNLSPGEYTFRVIASNNDGLWNNEGIAVKIIIFPPWWKTNLAYFLYLLVISSSIFLFHNYRLGLLTIRNQELEKKVQERTEELKQKNEQLNSKNRELAENYEDLLQLNQKANRIFAVLSEALPGTVLDGKYKLEEKIGSGGFGAVYKAMHLNIKRHVAVKVFSPSPGNDSVENLERFQREAISTCRVNHPNAVAILDSGISSEGIPYLVMELLQGHTLKSELRKEGKLSVKRCAEIAIPICKVLSKAHKSGIIHRDIKPDNIFLHYTIEGEVVKVLDFGIAKLIDMGESEQNNLHLTKTGGIIGTPIYMAPERLALKAYDGSSDTYSLGIILYELLSGRLPFQDKMSSFPAITAAHLFQEPNPIKDFTPETPDEIEAIVLAALKKKPEERPSLEEIASIFANITGIEYKSLHTTEEIELKGEKDQDVSKSEQATIIISAKKSSPDTDKIIPSEQITLQKPNE